MIHRLLPMAYLRLICLSPGTPSYGRQLNRHGSWQHPPLANLILVCQQLSCPQPAFIKEGPNNPSLAALGSHCTQSPHHTAFRTVGHDLITPAAGRPLPSSPLKLPSSSWDPIIHGRPPLAHLHLIRQSQSFPPQTPVIGLSFLGRLGRL